MRPRDTIDEIRTRVPIPSGTWVGVLELKIRYVGHVALSEEQDEERSGAAPVKEDRQLHNRQVKKTGSPAPIARGDG
jgi:hypothetical protein